MFSSCAGAVNLQWFSDDDQNEGIVRPVVALKDSIEGTYDSSTGLWTLFEKAVDELSESSITLSYSETEWTNENVTLTASTSTSYTLQYTTDDPTSDSATWTTGSSYEMTENGNVYFRLTDGTDVSSFYATGTITNIDKIAPTAEISITDHTSDSITVEAIGNDDDSGIYSYEFQISEDGENWETTDIIISSDTSYSYTYEDLTQYTEYYVRVVVTDVAGNSTTSESVSVTTSVDLDTAIITLTPSTTEWTNETVTVTATTETAGVYIEMSTDGSSWSTTSTVTVSANCTVYARLVDFEDNISEYASLEVTNIDTLSPTASFTVSSTAASYSNYSTAGTITITSSSSDATATSSSGKSGIATYYYSIDGGSSWKSSSSSSYTFSSTSTEDDYTVAMKVVDNAGNTSSTSSKSYTPITGDWVDYPIDINEDGDTTNDWRLLYVNDDGVMFIIAADYVETAGTYIKSAVSSCGMTTYTNGTTLSGTTYTSPYVVSWESVPSKKTISSTIKSLFMANSSLLSSSTNNNIKCISTLLYTSYWKALVDSNYAQYAIGGATMEMWIASWNDKYTNLYYSSGTTGYYVGTSKSPSGTEVYVTDAYVSNSGYDDTIYWSTQSSLAFGSSCYNRSYYLASPSAVNADSLVCVDYDGNLSRDDYYVSGGYVESLRPVVALKSSVTGTYDSSTGIWTLSK